MSNLHPAVEILKNNIGITSPDQTVVALAHQGMLAEGKAGKAMSIISSTFFSDSYPVELITDMLCWEDVLVPLSA